MGIFKNINEWRIKELKKAEEQKKIADQNLQMLKEKKEEELLLKNQIKDKQNILKNDRYKIHEELTSKGFEVDKALGIEKWVLFIDDANKKFVLNNKNAYTIYNFSDLLNFELNEDGNATIKGKTGSAVVGGLMFGSIGAIAGASGAKKTEKECTYMAVRLLLNDLENPELNIELIKRPTPKESGTYKKKLKEAQAVTALLSYIQNNA